MRSESQTLGYVDDGLMATGEGASVTMGGVSQLAATPGDPASDPSLLAMAQLYGRLRALPGIWQMMISEILQRNDYSIIRIAHDLHVSARTVKRILHNQTSNPCVETGFRLFFLHFRCFPQNYRVAADRDSK